MYVSTIISHAHSHSHLVLSFAIKHAFPRLDKVGLKICLGRHLVGTQKSD